MKSADCWGMFRRARTENETFANHHASKPAPHHPPPPYLLLQKKNVPLFKDDASFFDVDNIRRIDGMPGSPGNVRPFA